MRVAFLQGWACLAWSVVSLLPLDVCKWKLDEPGQDTGSWGARKSFGESQTAYQGLFRQQLDGHCCALSFCCFIYSSNLVSSPLFFGVRKKGSEERQSEERETEERESRERKKRRESAEGKWGE